MYVQRYMQHFPAAGEIVIFDRSWYNRAGVEYVMGFCSKEEYRRFLEVCPEVERFIVDAGVQLIKFWLEVGDEEQKRRFEARIDDPLRQWKLSTMDMPSRSKWYAYSRARDQMLEATDTERAVAYRPFRRQAPRAAEPHRAFPQPYSPRGSTARKGRTA
jgi:polyphosphate kinase 2 (PPK2 family)